MYEVFAKRASARKGPVQNTHTHINRFVSGVRTVWCQTQTSGICRYVVLIWEHGKFVLCLLKSVDGTTGNNPKNGYPGEKNIRFAELMHFF